jgi:hypothetical protein
MGSTRNKNNTWSATDNQLRAGPMLTFEEAAEAFERLLPLGMSARQALNLVRPIGGALAEKEEETVKKIFSEATKSKTADDHEKIDENTEKDIRRLYIEMDGILARMRRGTVPMEDHEQKRDGDVHREVKVGAIFEAVQGRERSELVPDVYIDTRHPKAGNSMWLDAQPGEALPSYSMHKPGSRDWIERNKLSC